MHAWATSVEIVDTITRQSLKASRGEAKWLRFFAVMSSAIARLEHTPTVPGTPRAKRQLVRELKQLTDELDVFRVLANYRTGLSIAETPPKGVHWVVLELDAVKNVVTPYGFYYRDLEHAQGFYDQLEAQDGPGINVVLVSVPEVKNLKRAYPNYFLDSRIFLSLLEDALAPGVS